ncbi:MAG: sulfite exporter TauE/SafE family protein [Planctomycetota bacterium]
MAVLVASVMGSLHCVGMCGPFALWATGASVNGRRKQHPWLPIATYHLGRLLTYCAGAVLVGAAGALLSMGGNYVGIQSVAARVAGAAMIGMGLWRLAKVIRVWWQRPGANANHQLSVTTSVAAPNYKRGLTGRIAQTIAKLRPTINRLPLAGRAFAAGSVTTLLPCGWLYVFLLVAGGTGTVASSVGVMFAFWLGSLPALTTLMVGAIGLAPGMKRGLPIAGAALLLMTGFYTATGRAEADLSSLTRLSVNASAVLHSTAEETREGDCCCQPSGSDTGDLSVGNPSADRNAIAAERLGALLDEPLPCCIDDR